MPYLSPLSHVLGFAFATGHMLFVSWFIFSGASPALIHVILNFDYLQFFCFCVWLRSTACWLVSRYYSRLFQSADSYQVWWPANFSCYYPVFCSSSRRDILCFDRDCFFAICILSQLCFSCMYDSFNSCPLVDFLYCMFELPTFCCPGWSIFFFPYCREF